MLMKQLGETKLKVFPLGMNCLMSHEHDQNNKHHFIDHIHQAIDLGINFFDIDEINNPHYDENLFSKAFDGKWNNIILATKANMQHFTNKNQLKLACETTLNRLNVDVIDFYYCSNLNNHFPLEETMSVLTDLIAEGKIRYIGLTSENKDLLLQANAFYPITALPIHYHKHYNNTLTLCEELNMSFLMQLDHKDILNENVELTNSLAYFANIFSCRISDIILNWLAYKSSRMIPILNIDVADTISNYSNIFDFTLSPEIIKMLDKQFT